MVTYNSNVVCPYCGKANCYTINKLDLVDIDLHASYSCDACHNEYTDIYALVYLGCNAMSKQYDRDNCIISR